MTIQSFRDLMVWQKAMLLAKDTYKATTFLPKEEIYGLVSQIRRCAVSIPSNIAEGKERSTRKDFAQFLRIAQGSGAELETQILLSIQIYPDTEKHFQAPLATLKEVQKMLSSIIMKLSN
jgi:four helix bundle protein